MCPEHEINPTNSGDCPECSKLAPEILPEADFNESDNRQAASNVVDEKEESVTEDEFMTESKIDIKESNPEQMNNFQGNRIGNVQYIKVSTGLSEHDDKQLSISLFEKSETIELKEFNDLENSPLEIIQNFKQERILLLGDSGDGNSYRVSHQIARSLEINNKEENIRLLSLSNYRSHPVRVQSLSLERKSANNKAVQDALIIVDATQEGAAFTDSLLKNASVSLVDDYPQKLRNNKLFMICLLDADSIIYWQTLNKRIFPYWIPNKKDEKPSLENISEVSRKVKDLLKLESEADARIIRIILFIVCFFPNLTTGDFNDLLAEWLKNEPEMTVKEAVKNESDAETLTKIALWDVWKSKSRFFTEQCFLSQIKDEQSKRRVINFYDESYGRHIKAQLEKYYWSFVDQKISEILYLRLIFHPSDNIASQSIAVLAEYLPGNEEKYIDWLLWVFNVLNDEEHAENLRQMLGISEQTPSGITEETGKQYFYYNRLAKLFRTILRDSSLKTTVSNIMERLVQDRCYQSALKLIKSLQSAPNFDELYWLRQLLERGDKTTEIQIRKYLFNNLVNLEIADVLNKLNEWLPKENKFSENYSQSNKMALTLLIKYYSYQINIFDEELYGGEPSRFPLFNFESKSSADKSLDLLVRYFLHPVNLRLELYGMPYIYYAAFLLERWSKILCKNNLSAGMAINDEETISNWEILNILLEKVVRTSSKKEQENIKSAWKELMSFNDVLYKNNADWEIRAQAIKDREFLTNLIELFNDKQWAVK
jgi:hypothetical protein